MVSFFFFRAGRARFVFAGLGAAVAPLIVACQSPPAATAPGEPCGYSPDDWCPSPPGDPCGVHHDTTSCKADARCTAMHYNGESVDACRFDARGFALNCPDVGCISATAARPPSP